MASVQEKIAQFNHLKIQQVDRSSVPSNQSTQKSKERNSIAKPIEAQKTTTTTPSIVENPFDSFDEIDSSISNALHAESSPPKQAINVHSTVQESVPQIKPRAPPPPPKPSTPIKLTTPESQRNPPPPPPLKSVRVNDNVTPPRNTPPPPPPLKPVIANGNVTPPRNTPPPPPAILQASPSKKIPPPPPPKPGELMKDPSKKVPPPPPPVPLEILRKSNPPPPPIRAATSSMKIESSPVLTREGSKKIPPPPPPKPLQQETSKRLPPPPPPKRVSEPTVNHQMEENTLFGNRISLSGTHAKEYRASHNMEVLDAVGLSKVSDDARKSCAHLSTYLIHSVKSIPYLQGASKSQYNFAILRVIYRWVANNIDYDIMSLLNGTVTPEKCQPNYVLRSGKAVCSGYSAIVQDLCTSAGLEVRTVSGWAKGMGFKAGDIINTSVQTNHAWNVVKLDDEYYHLDCTWSAGFVNGSQFTRMWQEHYFLTPSELFVLDHLPELSREQFLQPCVSVEEFSHFPTLKPCFFEAGMQIISHPDVIIEPPINDDEIRLKFTIGSDWQLLSGVIKEKESGREVPGLCCIFRKENEATVIARPPEGPGDFILTLFTSPKTTFSGSWAVEYLIRIPSKRTKPMAFPRFMPSECELLEPLRLQLNVGERILFRHVVIKEKRGVPFLILPGNEWIQMDKKSGDLFEKTYVMKYQGKVQICVAEVHGSGMNSKYMAGEYECI